MSMQDAKKDAGKPKLSLVPPQIIRDIAEVREYGNQKYGDPENWKSVELERYIDALYRHMLAFVEEPLSRDDESGIYHYKHMACNMAFICEMMKRNYHQPPYTEPDYDDPAWKFDSVANEPTVNPYVDYKAKFLRGE